MQSFKSPNPKHVLPSPVLNVLRFTVQNDVCEESDTIITVTDWARNVTIKVSAQKPCQTRQIFCMYALHTSGEDWLLRPPVKRVTVSNFNLKIVCLL